MIILRQPAPDTTVISDRHFIETGEITTAAAISAGIDATLIPSPNSMTQPTIALRTAEYMEYRWLPDKRSNRHN